MTSSISLLFNRSSLLVVLWIAIAIMCLQLAAANENTTAEAPVTGVVPEVGHHADTGAAGNETMSAKNDEPIPAAATKAPAAGTATSITPTSSIACLLTVICVAIARLF